VKGCVLMWPRGVAVKAAAAAVPFKEPFERPVEGLIQYCVGRMEGMLLAAVLPLDMCQAAHLLPWARSRCARASPQGACPQLPRRRRCALQPRDVRREEGRCSCRQAHLHAAHEGSKIWLLNVGQLWPAVRRVWACEGVRRCVCEPPVGAKVNTFARGQW
jgi:hypothetical protein